MIFYFSVRCHKICRFPENFLASGIHFVIVDALSDMTLPANQARSEFFPVFYTTKFVKNRISTVMLFCK
jgi:hypothetical protein